MKLGFLGTGTIATAVVQGLAPEGHEIWVSERSRANSAALSAAYENVQTANNASVVQEADVLCIALMPDTYEKALKGLPFRTGQRILSFMADVPLDALETLCAPASVEALVLPFPAIAQTRAPLIAYPASKLANELFQNHDVFSMDTAKEFDALLAAQAVLSPVAKILSDATDWAAAQGADAAKAESFLRSLIASNLTASELGPLLAALNTEGGYNARLRAHMDTAGTSDALKQGLSNL